MNTVLFQARVLTLWAVLAASCSPIYGAGLPNKNWPCIQRKVPELSVGTMWTLSDIDLEDQSWKKAVEIAKLVATTTSRRVSIEEAQKEIGSFMADHNGDKLAVATQIFTGQFQTINNQRRRVMAGIERYAKRQKALSEKIKTMSEELSALNAQSDLTDTQKKRLDEINEQLLWDTRIYDEREQSLRYVCETPVLLEQRLFALARQLSRLLQ